MDERLLDYSEKMEKAIDALYNEYTTIRAGRANPHILDKVKVDYYGSPSAIQQVANVSVPEARMIQIQPWEPGLIKEIEKAILMSDLGLTPTNDGKCIRLVFPELTEERRKELVKDVKKKGENTKVTIRNVRRDANDAFKKLNKASEISDDELKGLESDIQKLTDSMISKVDEAIDNKSKEVMTV
ncbi:ribosome recycling factor [Lachnospiraceae bacterium RM5]|nr:ribosome recycling factor [Lachnospiraceae bacterium RM5]